MRNYGFIKDEINPEDYIFGGGQIIADILQPTGQWDEFLPPEELQSTLTVETYACVSFGTLNALEILFRRVLGQVDNFSDRYLAYISGTKGKTGNSPHTVAEKLRKLGDVRQLDWDFTPDINTNEKFYAEPPSYLMAFAERFLDEYDFKHDYVPANPIAMKEALKYSPLGFSVTAWTKDENGLYYNVGANSHWVVCYGYEDGKYWKIYDSYSNDGTNLKKVRWDALPEVCKRYSVGKITVHSKQGTLDLIVDKIRSVILLIQAQLKLWQRS